LNRRAGYAALVGRPNVGKSTLLNRLLGQKLVITSHKPQTTRHSILGINSLQAGQIIYVDTPGIHQRGDKAMNRYLNRAAQTALVGVDLIVFVVDIRVWTDEEQMVLKQIREAGLPVLVAANKIDLVQPRENLLPLLVELSTRTEIEKLILRRLVMVVMSYSGRFCSYCLKAKTYFQRIRYQIVQNVFLQQN